MEFFLAYDLCLVDNALRVRETTLEQKRYYIEQILKPYLEGMLVGVIASRPSLIGRAICLRVEQNAARPTLPHIRTLSLS